MAKISLVLGTYNRMYLLKRSLVAYAAQSFKDFELVILDDWSTDDTDIQLRDWASSLNMVTLRPPFKQPGTWRDSASIINYGLRAATGELILMTHPEIIPGVHTLEKMWEHRKYWTYHAAKAYYLTQDNQRHLDEVPWEMDLLKVRELPDFYSKHPEILGPVQAFTHEATDQHRVWDSQIFSGMTRQSWREFGPITEYNEWGSVDIDFLQRRQALGIENLTECDPDTICVHQNHDLPDQSPHYVPSPRSIEIAMQGNRNYTRATALKGPLW